MKTIVSFFILLSIGIITIGQTQTQNVKGFIFDKISEQPLVGASVSIEPGSVSAITDTTGRFSLSRVPTGRIKINVSYLGYQSVSIPEVLVTVGKEVILELGLEQRSKSLESVVVRATRTRKGGVSNEYAGSSARSFSIDEVNRYAGGRNDPSKLVSNFAGVVSGNDGRNDIVVRGNSPAGVLWRIEGLPAPNPNHFSTLGTTGGPVSALNTNALRTSDFYTGAFPAEYGNATSAVFDINFRTGNTEKQERTVQLNFFSGLEAMIEGPLGKKGNGASYLLGYRYSFVQLGQSLGLKVGTSAVPKYQDWVYNIQFGKSHAGKFSLFGMGGISAIDFIGKNITSKDFYSRNDQDSYFKSNFYLFGGKHTVNLGKNTYLRTVVSYSNVKTSSESYQYPLPLPPYANRWQVSNLSDQQNVMRFSSILNQKNSGTFSWRAGVTGESYSLKTLVNDRKGKPSTGSFDTLRNYDNTFFLLQYFAQARYKPSEKFSLITGMHDLYFTFNKKNVVEPRVSIQYNPDIRNTISLSYGLHSQLQPLPVYLYQKQINGITYNNSKLDFSKAHHFVLGYENRFAPDWRLKTELYYQALFNIPVEETPSGFSMINAGSDFTFPEKAGLVYTGTGKNEGLEFTLERFLNKGYYFLTTASVFKSTYKGSDGLERNSTYNYGYAANLLAGREWKTGKRKTNAFTFDFRLANLGGKYTTPVDLTASKQQGKEVLDENYYNGERLDPYMRMDMKFGIRLNSKKRKLSQSFYLDLQNVTNKKNIFLRRYNPEYGTIGNVYQIGFFPDILYRIQF